MLFGHTKNFKSTYWEKIWETCRSLHPINLKFSLFFKKKDPLFMHKSSMLFLRKKENFLDTQKNFKSTYWEKIWETCRSLHPTNLKFYPNLYKRGTLNDAWIQYAIFEKNALFAQKHFKSTNWEKIWKNVSIITS